MNERTGPSVWQRIYRSGLGRIVLAGAVTALLFCAFSAVQTVSYLTNDDNAIAYTLAGYHTGAPAPYALFINCLLGYPVSALYRAAPGVAWWAVLQLAALAVSVATIGACMLHIGARRAVPVWIALGGFIALTALLFLQPVVELTYTVTAAVVGAASCALVITAADAKRPGVRTALDLFGGLLLLLAFLYREETGFALLCFFLAACGYRVLSAIRSAAVCKVNAPEPNAANKAPDREAALTRTTGFWGRGGKRAVVLFAATLLACMAAFAANNALQTAYHGAAYREFFRYRERFTDYPHDSYLENPALYASVGWDETVYDLADDWCFMDARINTAALKTIAEQASAQPISLADAAAACLEVLDGNVPLRMTAAFLLSAGVLALYALLKNKRCAPEAIALLCTLLGSVALCLLLGLSGRFLERTFRVIAIPACVLAALFSLRLYAPCPNRADRIAFAAFAAVLAVLAAVGGALQAKDLRVNSPKYLLADSRAVTAYALAHPENAYVRDVYVIADVDATTTYPGAKPINLISWGGCEMHSETARRQLTANGLTSCYADVFFAPNVFFITRAGSGEYAVLARYLAKAYPGASLIQTDAVTDAIAVYRVEFPDAAAAE